MFKHVIFYYCSIHHKLLVLKHFSGNAYMGM